MSFCSNCGFKCSDNSVFCSNCGKEINNDENVNCNKTIRNNSNVFSDDPDCVSKDISSNNINTDYLLEGVKTYYKILRNPIKGSKNFIENSNKNVTFVTVILSLILQGILYLWKINELNSQLFDIIKKFVFSISKLLGEFSSEFSPSDVESFYNFSGINKNITTIKNYFPINNFKVFLYGLLFSIIIFISIYACLYILNRHSVNKLTLLKIITVASIPLVAGGFVSVLMSYASEKIGIVVLIFALLISIGSLFNNYSKYILDSKSSTIHVSIALIVTLVLLILIMGSLFMTISKDFLTNLIRLGEDIESLIP